MRDTPSDMTSTIVCPACGAENVETLPGAGGVEAPEYRCLDCGNEFNASGGDPPLADSDDPNAP
jgi:transposase-like protein